MRYLIAGNWKMHTLKDEAVWIAWEVAQHAGKRPEVEVMIAPPFIWLFHVANTLVDTPVRLGAQNVHWEDQGAFTGEISAPMLKDIGCSYVIVGHSERRRYFGETNEMIRDKLRAVYRHGMKPILCVGETLEERESGITMEVIENQIKIALDGIPEAEELIIAYEPVWAIGTGKAAHPEQAQEVHAFIKNVAGERLPKSMQLRMLYGGSVKPSNIDGFLSMPDIHGALVGGASLKPEDFNAIVDSAATASSKSRNE